MPQINSNDQNQLAPTKEEFIYDIAGITKSLNLIKAATNWQEKYRQLMLMGKHLPRLADNLRLTQAEVKGCESQAWLYHCNIDGKHHYLADSDARIVKGLIAILIVSLHGKSQKEIVDFDAQDYFAILGFDGQLSPSRTNGLRALVSKMKNLINTEIKD